MWTVKISFRGLLSTVALIRRLIVPVLVVFLSAVSIFVFVFYWQNGLGLAYNDARSHLDIGRRVVEGLKPGLAQLGSVWLPLTHFLMVPTVWNDFMWHSGLSGGLQSMVAFIATGLIVYKFLERLQVKMLGRLVGVAVFVANLNILYLQSTAMTELPLLATMTVGCYYLLRWQQDDRLLDLVKASFWIMISTLIRYDGWFLLAAAAVLVLFRTWTRRGYQIAEGIVILFGTLGAFGIGLWLLWNQLIFKDALYFALGPFSARAQQIQLANAGDLPTKYNLWLSTKVYLYALFYNSYTLPVILALGGAIALWWDRRLPAAVRVSTLSLLAPLAFNVLALYLGFSVLFVQGISGDTWFNIRYGVMLMPAIAVFIGYLVHRAKGLRWVVIGLLSFVLFFALANQDAVTVDDARVGSSQKNVSEVAGFLATHAKNERGFVLVSVASHDAIIFSSGLPMKRFIHEGTGAYWEMATTVPDRWARWIIMRTHDQNDLTWKAVSQTPGFARYTKVGSYPFADIYELQPQYLSDLIVDPIFGKQK